MKTIKNLLLVSTAICFAGCVTGYTLVATGVNSIDTLQVEAGPGWNLAPNYAGTGRRKNSQTWTQDGMLLNRLVFVPAVADGEALLDVADESAALPVFRKDMLPNEIEELAESTFVKIYGEGNAVFSTSNLRPQTFGDHRGIMFDVEAQVTESPDYRGMVGAFIVNEKLYFMYYLAAHPHYYVKHRDAAEAIIKSATLAVPAEQA
ncbi:MAG: hypothetical protein KAJ57_04050 [Woeseiaceae bacterium]|nr:hypothetical protein [Woeseiaceae bacterium]